MRPPELEQFLATFARRSRMERRDNFRSPLTRSVHHEQIDVQQLTYRDVRDIRNGDGFWWTWGYSTLDGGDEMRD